MIGVYEGVARDAGRLIWVPSCLCYERRRAKSPKQRRPVVRSSTGSAREGYWCARIWTRRATVTAFRHRYCGETLIGATGMDLDHVPLPRSGTRHNRFPMVHFRCGQ